MRKSTALISKLLVFFVAIFLTFSGCRKSNPTEAVIVVENNSLKNKFFNVENVEDKDIKNFAREIETRNEKEGFLKNFIGNNGYIQWKNAQKLRIALDEIVRRYGNNINNITPANARVEMTLLMDRIRTAIAANPGVNLNYINF